MKEFITIHKCPAETPWAHNPKEHLHLSLVRESFNKLGLALDCDVNINFVSDEEFWHEEYKEEAITDTAKIVEFINKLFNETIKKGNNPPRSY